MGLVSCMPRLFLITASLGLLVGLAIAQEVSHPLTNVGGLTGSGHDPLQVEDCISPLERAQAEEVVRQYFKRHPSRTGRMSGTPPLFTFWPQGGRLSDDLFTNNYVDLDPGTGLLDWDCSAYTYDGHRGNDTSPVSFGEQAIGVPVFSALDGVVISSHDGEPDMNTSCQGIGNSVIIDHGMGRLVYYWHFKTNSVIVSSGQTVKAGQQIGLVGSSGCSTGPHLHFEVHDNGIPTEPYSGTCNRETSQWTDQTPIRRDMYVRDFGVTHLNMNNEPWLPYALPRSAQLELNDTLGYYWVKVHNVPAFSTWQWQFVRPNGTIAYTSSVGTYNISVLFRSAWWFFTWNIADMHTIPGTWTVRYWMNGSLMVESPIEVVANRDPNFNRPPNPVSTAIEPVLPTTDDVIQCNVDSSLILDDL
ncbi:MAG: M23 family metallopeptidase, partial [Planctomycetota bacterium]|nr:M23 family metallopeptidase [Planctomycetota bacterium]